MTTNPIRISTATEIVTAVPALLGFIPQRSVVAILLDGAKVVCAIRVDAGMDHLAAQLLPVAKKYAIDSVILVSVADAQHTDQSLATLEAIRATLATAGVETRRALHTAATEQGAEWTDIETGERGVVDNPSTSATNLASLVQGRNFAASREAIENIYASESSDSTAEVNRARSTSRVQGRQSFARTTVTELAALMTARQTPSVELAARVGVMMADDVEARDIVLGLGTSTPIEAHDAVAAIARHLTGIERAEALTVAGYFAYVAGRGPDAGIAFTEAENAAVAAGQAPPRQLTLLNRALSNGMAPAQIRSLGDAGIETARKRRVSLTAS
ncbi:DUF4192 domain-containing protein [Prescottella equi]|uniref:DUF4192 domain-containing protein n=1 Tax=Rhodococcus hoagii TaxID=43767 RepID=UPI00131AEA86|nr:DUF4192 domain-containing protein [Prescottella equi]